MKSLKTTALLLAMSLGLSACDPIEGTLQVLQAFSAKVGTSKTCHDYEYPCDNQETITTIQPGSLSMSIDMLGKDTVQITLGSNRQVMELKVPKGKEIPATGHLTLTSQESGQPFDLHAQTETTVTDGPETHTEERCEISYQEKVCGYVGNPPQYRCWWETHYRPGLQEVSYYYKTTHQTMQAQLHQNSSQVAIFNGSRTENEKIYTYKGYCRPSWY